MSDIVYFLINIWQVLGNGLSLVFHNDMLIAIVVYSICLLFIIIEKIDKAIVALCGALVLILAGIFTTEEAIKQIHFETILLLMGMMMIMYITQKSGLFSWVSTKIVGLTKGNPLYLFVVFLLITAVFSAFFDNVTTILIVVPITIAITQGMGLDSRIFVISEIMFSNIGGSMTLIGDPPNILIGSKVGLTFNEFVLNLWIPVLVSIIVIMFLLIIFFWKKIKPLQQDLVKLFLAHMLIRKIAHQFYKKIIKKPFVFTAVFILIATVFGFIFQKEVGLDPGIIAMLSAMILLILTTNHVNLHETFNKVEWPTLFFFMGLFILTGALEKTHALSYLSNGIVNLTDNFTYIILIVLWLSGLVSMLVDNIPFVAVMIPVVYDIQNIFVDHPAVGLLWWALSMGACFGGNGTMIGASANVVGISLAGKEGVKISFMEYTKLAFPMTIVSLIICSIYLVARIYI